MRPHAAAGRCKTDHYVIQPCIWNESKTLQDLVGSVFDQIHPLDEYGPVTTAD